MYLLDTNIVIFTLKNRFTAIREKIEKVGIDNIAVSSLTIAELEYGAAKSNNPDAARAKLYEFLMPFETKDFDTRAAECYGRIRASLEASGTPIGPIDTMIAAIAVSAHCTIVTNNTREFQRIEKLVVEDWTIS
jgi:tRNA(fMet)-specific endonuclease VapC